MRIASLISSATEMLFGIGLDDEIVAVSHECDHPSQAALRPKASFTNIAADAPSALIDRQVKELVAAGKPLYEVDIDLLAELRPDVIVTQAQCDVCAVRYDDVATAVAGEPSLRHTKLIALNPMSLGDILSDIRRVAAEVGRAEAGERYAASLAARIAAVANRTATLSAAERPLVACIEWIDPLMIAGNWNPELIHLAGGRQIWAEPGKHSTYTPWDDVRSADPDVIVVMPCGFDQIRTEREAESLKELPGWQDLNAVRSGRVHCVDGNALFNRSGPRLVDSLELLHKLLQPVP